MAKQKKKVKGKKVISWGYALIPLWALAFLIIGSYTIQNHPEIFNTGEPINDGNNCCEVIGFGDMEKVPGGLIIVYKTDCGEIIKKESFVIQEVGDIVCHP